MILPAEAIWVNNVRSFLFIFVSNVVVVHLCTCACVRVRAHTLLLDHNCLITTPLCSSPHPLSSSLNCTRVLLLIVTGAGAGTLPLLPLRAFNVRVPSDPRNPRIS